MNINRIIIVSSPNPFQLFMMISCVLTGISGLSAPRETSHAVEVLPKSLQVIWYIGLLLGGLLAIYGTIRNLFIERIADTLLTGITFGYWIVLINETSRPFTFAAFTVLAFSIACGSRVWQIREILKRGLS